MTMKILMTLVILFNLPAYLMSTEKMPNLIIIHTDEHNFRTLGCYRQSMDKEQAYMRGENAIVETPNIDKLAQEGALCHNWYASSPVCTPSRASMISGLYPIRTGSHRNDN